MHQEKQIFVVQLVKVASCLQANIEQYGQAQPFLGLRVYTGPSGQQEPNPTDLLVALGLHEDGALSFGGPLFAVGDVSDDTGSDSGMSVESQQEEDDDDNMDNNEDVDDNDDVDDEEVRIVHEFIQLD